MEKHSTIIPMHHHSKPKAKDYLGARAYANEALAYNSAAVRNFVRASEVLPMRFENENLSCRIDSTPSVPSIEGFPAAEDAPLHRTTSAAFILPENSMKNPNEDFHKNLDAVQTNGKAAIIADIKEKVAAGGTLPNVASKVKRIKIAAIETNDARQPRLALNNEHVGNLREKLENGVTLDPVIVFSTNGEAPYFLSDGWHRLKANKLLLYKEIDAEIREGGEFEAFKSSLGANDDHGLPRTNADKQNAVKLAFADERLKDLSDNFIAEICKVSQPFVSKLRKQVITVITGNADSGSKTNSAPSKRTGKDGKAQSGTKQKTEPKPKTAEEIFDDNGILVPEHLHEAWRDENATILDLQMHAYVLLDKWPSKMYGEQSETQKRTLKALIAALSIEICPECKGEKCKKCDKRGMKSKRPLLGSVK